MEGDDWIGLSTERLPTEEAMAWATLPSCGAVVAFAGVVRDNSEGRPHVTSLTYEAYETEVKWVAGNRIHLPGDRNACHLGRDRREHPRVPIEHEWPIAQDRLRHMIVQAH